MTSQSYIKQPVHFITSLLSVVAGDVLLSQNGSFNLCVLFRCQFQNLPPITPTTLTREPLGLSCCSTASYHESVYFRFIKSVEAFLPMGAFDRLHSLKKINVQVLFTFSYLFTSIIVLLFKTFKKTDTYI